MYVHLFQSRWNSKVFIIYVIFRLSYIISDHHFSASALLYFGKMSHFLIYLSTSWCMAPPYSRNLAPSQMNGPCSVLGDYLFVFFKSGSGEGALYRSLFTNYFVNLVFGPNFQSFQNLFYLKKMKSCLGLRVWVGCVYYCPSYPQRVLWLPDNKKLPPKNERTSPGVENDNSFLLRRGGGPLL